MFPSLRSLSSTFCFFVSLDSSLVVSQEAICPSSDTVLFALSGNPASRELSALDDLTGLGSARAAGPAYLNACLLEL